MRESKFPLVLLALLMNACGDDVQTRSPGMENTASSAAGWDATTLGRVTGRVFYREAVIPPAGSTLTVTLLDASVADVISTKLAEQVVENIADPPIPFAVEFSPEEIQPGHSYVIAASVEHEGKLIMISDTSIPVLRVSPDEDHADIEVTVVHSQKENVSRSLVGSRWEFTMANGEEVLVPANGHRPYFQLDAETGRISGSTGCNQFSGTYSSEGREFELGQLMVSLKACPEGMEIERQMLDALNATRRFEIDGKNLRLSRADGSATWDFSAADTE